MFLDKFLAKIKNLCLEHKILLFFMFLHITVWTLVSLIRLVLPADTLESIYWGSLFDIGTNKHPPLAAWILYPLWKVFKSDFVIYFLSQFFIVIGMWYIYRLARFFLDVRKAVLSVILLEGCWVYSYMTAYNGFNPNFILFLFLPAITFYFYKSVKYNKTCDWILLGIFTGLGLLGKYQTILTIASLFIWSLIFKPQLFKNKKVYLSAFIAFILFIPHIIWLFIHDFLPFGYINSKFAVDSEGILGYLKEAFKFLIMQVICVIGTLLIYFIYRKRKKSPFVLSERNNDFCFLIIVGFLPNLLQVIPAICSGTVINISWGFEFLYMTGILLFYLLPSEVSMDDFKFMAKAVFVVMLLTFIPISTMFIVEKNYRSRYPVHDVFNYLDTQWQKQFHTKIKYFGGMYEYVTPVVMYGEYPTKYILDTYEKENPWIDTKDLKKSGAVFIERGNPDSKEIDYYIGYYIQSVFPDIDRSKLQIKVLPFVVHNVFNKPRNYEFYYIFVPPENN